MDVIECIRTRMSIRKFKPDPVSEELMLKVIEVTLRSPSYKNTQPWEVAIVSGNKKEELSKRLVQKAEQRTPYYPDIPHPDSWPAEMEARIEEHAKRRCEAIGLDLSKPEERKKAMMDNYKFFGAPSVIFLYQDSSLSPWSIFDMGLFAQSLMLSAHAYGLGTVAQAFLTNYPDEVKEFLKIPFSKRLILGISIGYPDLSDIANSYKSKRVDIKNVMTFYK